MFLQRSKKCKFAKKAKKKTTIVFVTSKRKGPTRNTNFRFRCEKLKKCEKVPQQNAILTTIAPETTF